MEEETTTRPPPAPSSFFQRSMLRCPSPPGDIEERKKLQQCLYLPTNNKLLIHKKTPEPKFREGNKRKKKGAWVVLSGCYIVADRMPAGRYIFKLAFLYFSVVCLSLHNLTRLTLIPQHTKKSAILIFPLPRIHPPHRQLKRQREDFDQSNRVATSALLACARTDVTPSPQNQSLNPSSQAKANAQEKAGQADRQ